MSNFERLIKKYFILLIVLLPLRKMGVFLVMAFGQEAMLDYFGSFEEYQLGYEKLLWTIEIINIYSINLLIALIVLLDLKHSRKLIGIPVLTVLMPIFGLTLFFVQKFYSLNYLKINNERSN